MQQLEKRYIKAKQRLFDKIYEAKLNRQQCEAVFTVKGPLLVLAGAGSGKTTVLVNRIAYLIKYGNAYYSDVISEELSEETVSALEEAVNLSEEEINQILPSFICDTCMPYNILAITFTNKAANEIKERIEKTFSDDNLSVSSVNAGTFHSICMRILRKFYDRLGYAPSMSIYDTDDKKRLISVCMKELGIDEKNLPARSVCNEISIAKDKLIGCDEYSKPTDPREERIRSIYKLYEKKLREYNAVDFDDIIMKTVKLLSENEDVLKYYQNKFKYILVDEYQDTNYAQFELVNMLAGDTKNIMVVGDDDQSIYAFRGATVENILGFDKTYPDAKVIKLEQNYRSTENILNAANALIHNNTDRHEKTLWSDKGEGEKINLKEVDDQFCEGKYIIEKISHGVRVDGRKYSDFAVLYRVNEMSRSLETAFAKSGIPYKILGSMRFYDRKEIKDIVSYLTLLVSPTDNLRLKRIINEPKRKIGASTVEAIEQLAEENGTSMYEIISRADKYTILAKSKDKLCDFCNMMESIKASATLPSELLNAIFIKTGYYDMLKAEGFEGEGKISNIKEFISAAIEYEKRCEISGSEITLVGFLEEISLVSDVDKYDGEADSVVLMTIHSAKGLEFPVVFLAGMEDGIFPSVQNLFDPAAMSEERRLAYVAITRAKEKLYITHSKQRTMYGKTERNPLSVFIKEIPDNLFSHESERKIPPRQKSDYQTRPVRQVREKVSDEFTRSPEISTANRGRRGAADYGITKFSVGQRVLHSSFGEGVVLSAKDLGGDVLYEVKFNTGVTKKLMATFAKLKPVRG